MYDEIRAGIGCLMTANRDFFRVATVHCDNRNADRIPAPERADYQSVVRQAIEFTRPAEEEWMVVTHAQPNTSTVSFELARGVEASRSLTFQPPGNDLVHSGLFRSACQFLRTSWPGARSDAT